MPAQETQNLPDRLVFDDVDLELPSLAPEPTQYYGPEPKYPEGIGRDKMREAAIEAVNRIMQNDECLTRECSILMVRQKDDSVRLSDISIGDQNHTTSRHRTQQSRDIVGKFHNHPVGTAVHGDQRGVSVGDIRYLKRERNDEKSLDFDVTSYVLNGNTGLLHEVPYNQRHSSNQGIVIADFRDVIVEACEKAGVSMEGTYLEQPFDERVKKREGDLSAQRVDLMKQAGDDLGASILPGP